MAISSSSWKPGTSGNPMGRPRNDKSLTAALDGIVDKQELAQVVCDIATGKLTTSVAVQLDAVKYIYSRIEGSPVQAMRFQAEGAVMPLIFLHPGREAPEITSEPDAIEAEAADVSAQAPERLGSQSPAGESE